MIRFIGRTIKTPIVGYRHIRHQTLLKWFEEAQTVWLDSNSIEFYDSDHSVYEERFIRVGISQKLNVLLIVFSESDLGETIRIISSRKAVKKEREQHEERV